MKVRTWIAAIAFSATVGAAITGATLPGETREASLHEDCGFATWPRIPARCLDGIARAGVRVVAIESVAARAMRARFATAFGTAGEG
ncbi:MAG: hypothetical protein ACTSYE_02785 [Alphaproteobacteria bacterium]